MIERHFYRTTSSIWLGLVKGGGGMLKALLCAYQIVTDPDTDPETATRGVVTHILVPHCCSRNYYFVVVWLDQEGEPCSAQHVQFKTEAMDKFAVAAHILMVDPADEQFIKRALHLAAGCMRSFLSSFLCPAASRPLVNTSREDTVSTRTNQVTTRTSGRTRQVRKVFTVSGSTAVKNRGNKSQGSGVPLQGRC